MENGEWKRMKEKKKKKKKNECDTILVCAVRVADDSIRLICGEFLFQLKGENV